MSATGERGPDRGGERGETLIEALVAVAVTAMIGALAFPELRQAVGQAAFQQAATGVRADLRIARAQAIRSGQAVDVEVADDGRGYGWSPGPRRGLPGALALAPSGGVVRFYADGSAAGDALALGDGRRRADFALEPATGLLRAAP